MILRKYERRATDRLGFTLMEVLVVVAILVILAGTASIFVMRYLEDAKKDLAQQDIWALDKAAKTYLIRNGGQPPQSLDQVLQYLEGGSTSNLIDPWGNQYGYEIIEFNGQQNTIHIFSQTDGTEMRDNLKR